jgi:CTP:molybdopterin cytidylyltransferase MocA
MEAPRNYTSPSLACVLLAAGGSSRLGTPKQLVRLRGRPLLLRAIDAATSVVEPSAVVVVLGAHALRLRALLRRAGGGTRPVVNARWPDGLAGSLQAGLDAVPREARAALVMLVDQPKVDRRSVRRLAAAWRKRPRIAAAAWYGGRLGVPAILPRSTWRTLSESSGDTGARALLRQAAHVTAVEMPEAAFDLDRPEDLDRLR